MNIQHKQLNHKGAFFIEIESVKKAHMSYSMAGTDKLIIDHTEVSEDLRGKGTAQKLVEKAVLYARENNIKILPLCTFANTVMTKNKDYQDILVQ